MIQGFAPCEESTFTPYRDHISMDSDPSTKGVEPYKIDQLPCHPSCCGQPTPVPFDGLTSNELKQCLANSNNKDGKYVWNSFRCSYGATGCPCMPKSVFGFESSRGWNNGTQKPWIDPTWMLNGKEVDAQSDVNVPPYQKLDAQKSYYDSGRLLNDNQQRVAQTDVKNVVGGSR
jgi:hypothetical protein